jgi:hypothetical protein
MVLRPTPLPGRTGRSRAPRLRLAKSPSTNQICHLSATAPRAPRGPATGGSVPFEKEAATRFALRDAANRRAVQRRRRRIGLSTIGKSAGALPRGPARRFRPGPRTKAGIGAPFCARWLIARRSTPFRSTYLRRWSLCCTAAGVLGSAQSPQSPISHFSDAFQRL